MFHCYARSEGIAAVIISKDYPQMTAHAILSKVVDEFLSQHPTREIESKSAKDGEISFPALRNHLDTCQDPGKASNITAIQQQLDETKIILHKTIDSVCLFILLLSPLVLVVCIHMRVFDGGDRC